MQGWMIALIVIACVIVFLAVMTVVGSAVALKAVLGKRGKYKNKKDNPEKYGVDLKWFDEVSEFSRDAEIESYDGTRLIAVRLVHPDEDNVKRVAVLQHGYWATPRSMQAQARIFWEKGYDVIMPAARAHDRSGGKYVGMAWLDRFDILRWVDKVIELYGSDVSVILVGVSMGGATVAAASGMNPPPQVKCVIDDCGFSSQKEEYYACLKKVPLPKAVAMLPLTIGVRFACGYSIYDADIKPLVARSTLPTLFIHGVKDTFVPCELGKKLYEACGASDKRLELFDAPHACSFVSDRERYTALVSDFADKYIA